MTSNEPARDEPETYRLRREPATGRRGRPAEQVFQPTLSRETPTEEHPPAPQPAAARAATHAWQRLLVAKLPLESETAAYILVSVLDFLMTYFLLVGDGPGNIRFVESNPIARYFIESWGPVKGMLGFKLAILTFVCVLAQLIALRRVDLGRLVLLFGTLATSGVVIYSLLLYLRST